MKSVAFFLFILSIAPVEALATSPVACQQPSYNICNAGCPGTSACYRRCRNAFCGQGTNPDIGNDPNLGAGYGFGNGQGGIPPLLAQFFYGPFFPSWGPDAIYLQQLMSQLQSDRAQLVQFQQQLQSSGIDGLLGSLLNANVQAQIQQIDWQINSLQQGYYPLFAQN